MEVSERAQQNDYVEDRTSAIGPSPIGAKKKKKEKMEKKITVASDGPSDENWDIERNKHTRSKSFSPFAALVDK